jgi:hypothetical protein
MSVKLGVGVSQKRANIIGERAKHVPDKEKKSCGEAVALLRYKEDFVQQNRHSTTPKTGSFHDEKSIILKKK